VICVEVGDDETFHALEDLGSVIWNAAACGDVRLAAVRPARS
jgi:hypothetical protein